MRVSVDPWAVVTGALLLMVVPLPWLGACVTAATFHEICHLAAAHFTGGNIEGIKIGITGAKIFLHFQNRKQETLTALAGPGGSFFLLTFFRIAPEIALCGVVQGLWNLLPLYPLDGGRALRCLLAQWDPDRGEKIFRLVEGLTLLSLSFTACVASLWLHMGAWPVTIMGFVVLRWLCQKNSLQIVGNQGTIVLPITKR